MQVHGVVTFCFISFDKSTVQCVFSFQAKISALKDKFSNFQAQWDEDTRHGQLPQTIVDTSRLAQESHRPGWFQARWCCPKEVAPAMQQGIASVVPPRRQGKHDESRRICANRGAQAC